VSRVGWSSNASAHEAVEEALAAHGSAVDALLAGYFTIAGADPRALLAPTVALVAGTGAGARAFDGRAIQAGKGIPRPRGIVGDRIPAVARVSVPRTVETVTLLAAGRLRRSMRDAATRGVQLARSLGEDRRADLLRNVADAGPLPLRKTTSIEAMMRIGGPNAGGLLTPEDLVGPEPSEVDAAVLSPVAETGERVRIACEPWPAPEPEEGSTESSRDRAIELVFAVDEWGVIGALALHVGSCGSDRDGSLMLVPELGVALPLAGVPVRRGKTRVAPGTVLPAVASVAAVDCGPDLRVVLGAASAHGIVREALLGAMVMRPISKALEEVAAHSPIVAAIAGANEGRGWSSSASTSAPG
jgi:gamma-glutamyltranspeptidase/glutathione hydrolase